MNDNDDLHLKLKQIMDEEFFAKLSNFVEESNIKYNNKKNKKIRVKVNLPKDAPINEVANQYMEIAIGATRRSWNQAIDTMFDSLEVIANDFYDRYGDNNWPEFIKLISITVEKSQFLDENYKSEFKEHVVEMIKNTEEMSEEGKKIKFTRENIFTLLKILRQVGKNLYFVLGDMFNFFSKKTIDFESLKNTKIDDEITLKNEKIDDEITGMYGEHIYSDENIEEIKLMLKNLKPAQQFFNNLVTGKVTLTQAIIKIKENVESKTFNALKNFNVDKTNDTLKELLKEERLKNEHDMIKEMILTLSHPIIKQFYNEIDNIDKEINLFNENFDSEEQKELEQLKRAVEGTGPFCTPSSR